MFEATLRNRSQPELGSLTISFPIPEERYPEDKIQLFEDKRIRTAWDAEKEECFFSIVDVVAVLTDQPDQRHAAKYWSVLKTRLKKEGSELTTKCSQLKMRSADGKCYNTDVADTEQLLRIIQSIPSPKAEPFKLWLAQVGRERIEETIDPELTIDRAMMEYKRLGYSDNWINQRLKSIEVRKDLTDEPMTNREQNCAYTSFAEVRKRKAKPMEEERIVYTCYSPYTAVSYLVLER